MANPKKAAADDNAPQAPIAAADTTKSATAASQEAPAATMPAPNGGAPKKGHTHRVNWTLWRGHKCYHEGQTLALTDEQAAKLGDVVTKL